jgi:hypothetical protein
MEFQKNLRETTFFVLPQRTQRNNIVIPAKAGTIINNHFHKTLINLARPEGRSQIRSTKSEILNKSESPKLKIQNKS